MAAQEAFKRFLQPVGQGFMTGWVAPAERRSASVKPAWLDTLLRATAVPTIVAIRPTFLTPLHHRMEEVTGYLFGRDGPRHGSI